MTTEEALKVLENISTLLNDLGAKKASKSLNDVAKTLQRLEDQLEQFYRDQAGPSI